MSDACSNDKSKDDIMRNICSKVCSIDSKIPQPPQPDPPPKPPVRVRSLVTKAFGIAGCIFLGSAIWLYYAEGLSYGIGFENGALTFSDGESIAHIGK